MVSVSPAKSPFESIVAEQHLGSCAENGSESIELPFLVHGLRNKGKLSRSHCLATLRTHCYIALRSKPHYIRTEFGEDHASTSVNEPKAPPSSPEDSQCFQEALYESYQSLKANLQSPAFKKGLGVTTTERSSGSELANLEGSLMRSVMDLSDSLVDTPSARSEQWQKFAVHWGPAVNAVVNEALASLAQHDRVAAFCTPLQDALNYAFFVRASSWEDEEWVVVDL